MILYILQNYHTMGGRPDRFVQPPSTAHRSMTLTQKELEVRFLHIATCILRFKFVITYIRHWSTVRASKNSSFTIYYYINVFLFGLSIFYFKRKGIGCASPSMLSCSCYYMYNSCDKSRDLHIIIMKKIIYLEFRN